MNNHQLELTLEIHQSDYLIATEYNELIQFYLLNLYKYHWKMMKQ
jgi:hypothetical protein